MTRNSTAVSHVVRMNRRSSTGSGYPLWMRTLEEKYQKLHKKITENTGATRFTSYVGRSVCDARISQAINKYRALAQKSALRAVELKAGGTNNNENSDLLFENTKHDLQNQYLDKTDTNCWDNEGFENCENGDEIRPMSPCESQANDQNRVECLSEQSNIDDDERIYDENDVECMNVEEADAEVVDVEEVENFSAGFVPDPKVLVGRNLDKTRTVVEGEQNKINNERYDRRHLQTSLSRASKTTSKSCPAKIQNHHQIHHIHKHPSSHGHVIGGQGHMHSGQGQAQKQLLATRSRSVHRHRMFTPMSAEAKHAITETIQEMSISTGRTEMDANFVPSRGRVCVKNWSSGKKPKQAYNTNAVLDNASHFLNNMNNVESAKPTEKPPSLNGSCRSSAGSGTRRSESRLPEIQNGSTRDRSNNDRRQSYIIPGIGKYKISSEEPVFEITPPGFDIRYTDVEPHEERESETPPPDIRQRAIDKCSEWLVKYNK
ncbi:uncharacterized protein LOC128241229 [Mya arenaria]|uniref:uncharacterized protein LOC128241229 n=1 Tax=Mya arenaria TaxID=6604 RepID=UPI0022E01595|nr:uncharacterized protein LOC128241229 [Mya arenaria]XP_052814223.1 uncharacterized protein LOC128241229 [Mya arenaria]XP_052814280.1 uncharacterized protein LOC128241229 [Mya arenaria]